MKPQYIFISFALSALGLANFGFAHGEGEKMSAWARLGIPDPNQIILFSGIIIFLAIFSALLFRKHLRDGHKKVLFAIIAVVAIIGTLYLAGATVYLNQKSWSHGPVHWHADFEIQACGEHIDLVDPEGLQNYVGDATVHEHGDNRIHMEGVMFEREDAELSEFFEALGGEFSENTMRIPTNKGYIAWTNGELCNGVPAEWHTFVNGKLIDSKEAPEYVISPWQTVPPGDTIKFVFGEKMPEEINPNIGEEH